MLSGDLRDEFVELAIMEEESGGALGTLGKLIPSIYYDVIARVCAGVPFLAVLFWPHRSGVGELTWSKLAMLVGAGYVMGLVLTPLSLPWFLVHGVRRYGWQFWKWKDKIDLTEGVSCTDEIAAKDKEAGEVLAKMQAEAVLCENLFGGFVVLLIVNRWFQIPLIAHCGTYCWVTILLLLGAGSIHRILAYITREKRLYRIYVGGNCTRPRDEKNTGITPAVGVGR